MKNYFSAILLGAAEERQVSGHECYLTHGHKQFAPRFTRSPNNGPGRTGSCSESIELSGIYPHRKAGNEWVILASMSFSEPGRTLALLARVSTLTQSTMSATQYCRRMKAPVGETRSSILSVPRMTTCWLTSAGTSVLSQGNIAERCARTISTWFNGVSQATPTRRGSVEALHRAKDKYVVHAWHITPARRLPILRELARHEIPIGAPGCRSNSLGR